MRFFGQTFFYKNNRNVGKDRVIRYYLGNTHRDEITMMMMMIATTPAPKMTNSSSRAHSRGRKNELISNRFQKERKSAMEKMMKMVGAADGKNDAPQVYVPAEAFGGIKSPERKAADVLHQLLTYTAAWVVVGQLESINCKISIETKDDAEESSDGQREVKRVKNQYEFLLDYLEKNAIKTSNTEEWLEKLSEHDQSLAQRIMTVRMHYAKDDFEWSNVRTLAEEDIERGNKRLTLKMLSSMM
jgi:hypothetical protein